MTNKIAIALALVIATFFAIDALFWGGHAPLFLARQLSDLVEYLSFWR